MRYLQNSMLTPPPPSLAYRLYVMSSNTCRTICSRHVLLRLLRKYVISSKTCKEHSHAVLFSTFVSSGPSEVPYSSSKIGRPCIYGICSPSLVLWQGQSLLWLVISWHECLSGWVGVQPPVTWRSVQASNLFSSMVPGSERYPMLESSLQIYC
jgi:hypothetical protein